MPPGFERNYDGKDGTPSLRMEEICDFDLWIQHSGFGFPYVTNDLDELSISNQFSYVI